MLNERENSPRIMRQGEFQNNQDKYKAVLEKMQDGTHVKNIFRHLVDYGKITSMEAFLDYGNTRVASTVNLLKNNYDLPIFTRMVNGKNRYGHRTTYGEYILWEEDDDSVES